MKKIFLVVAMCLFISIGVERLNADLLEVRVGAGLNFVDPDDFDKNFESTDAEDLETYNVDLFVNIPISPINAGFRYETSAQDDSGSSGVNDEKWELDVERFSILVDWRIIDTGIYVGPLASFGVHNGTLKINENGTSADLDLDPDSVSYTLAVEAGVRLKSWIIGGEFGYQNMKLENPSSSLFNVETDLSGGYAKVLVGYAFF